MKLLTPPPPPPPLALPPSPLLSFLQSSGERDSAAAAIATALQAMIVRATILAHTFTLLERTSTTAAPLPSVRARCRRDSPHTRPRPSFSLSVPPFSLAVQSTRATRSPHRDALFCSHHHTFILPLSFSLSLRCCGARTARRTRTR